MIPKPGQLVPTHPTVTFNCLLRCRCHYPSPVQDRYNLHFLHHYQAHGVINETRYLCLFILGFLSQADESTPWSRGGASTPWCHGMASMSWCHGAASMLWSRASPNHCCRISYTLRGDAILFLWAANRRQVLLQFAWTELAEDGAFHDNEQRPFNATVMMPSPPSGNGDHFLRATTAAQIPAHDTSMCSLTHREGEGEFVLCTAGGSLRPSLLKYAGIARGSPCIIVFRNTHNRPNPFCSKNKPGF
ncbi:hypothetical protein EDB85DRAFT_671662 [Lactarius pseudohatsudake]|nr:hypothetical protein EDB85DRAFT_671662 [Lactarius pseudohatsudake]